MTFLIIPSLSEADPIPNLNQVEELLLAATVNQQHSSDIILVLRMCTSSDSWVFVNENDLKRWHFKLPPASFQPPFEETLFFYVQSAQA